MGNMSISDLSWYVSNCIIYLRTPTSISVYQKHFDQQA